MKKQPLLFLKLEKSFLSKAQLIPESLLSIIIFLIVFVGFYSLIISYLRNLNSANERLIANFLALEGIEIVRGIRNYRYAINSCRQTVGDETSTFCPEYATTSWLGDLGDNYTSTIKICISYNASTSNCDQPETLYLNDNAFFTHSITSTSSKFKRLITITATTTIANATSVEVISEVNWTENNKVILRGIIYNLEKIDQIIKNRPR